MYAISPEQFCLSMPVHNMYIIRTHQERKLESRKDDHKKNLMEGQPPFES